VGRDFGRHTDRDAIGAVDQQVGEAGRKDQRFAVLAVVVVDKVYSVPVQIAKQFRRDRSEAGFRVTHCGGGKASDRAKIPLAMDQAMPHVPILSHPDQGWVDHLFAVRVIAFHCLADDTRAFGGRRGGPQIKVVHRHEDAALRGFETITHIGKGAADDHAHRVIQIAVTELIGDIERLGASKDI